jgi:YtxH-like protein
MVPVSAPSDDDEDGARGAAGSKRNLSMEIEETVSDTNQGSGTGIVVAGVVGAMVGAGVALLLAPCSGKETRAWLASKGREMTDRTTNAFEQGRQSIRRAVDEIGRDGEITATMARP